MSGFIDEVLAIGDVDQDRNRPGHRKAVAWARVSTDMQDERGLSLPEQLRQIRDYAQREGIEVLGEFSEAASAYQKKARRPEFLRMLQRVKEDPEVTIVLVHDFSRFSRDSMNCRILIRELREGGVEVVSVSDPMFDPESVTGVYMEAITFAKNEAYSKEIAFHTRKGCRGNIETRDKETGWCYKNGGQPLWGYRAERLDRGGSRTRPLIKCIWKPDETIVSGRPLYEWTQEALGLAAKGASLDQIRDFCNQNGIPAPRKAFWGTSTWHALLQPHVLLKYCGHGVWNVHRKNGSERPRSEWVVAENAHPALISEDEARAILAARGQARQRGLQGLPGRSRGSGYALSGGLFKCGRCGANMIGYRTGSGRYYVCGSQPYRRGKGCGKGVYVPQDFVERAVLDGVESVLGACADPSGFTRMVNEELKRIWETKVGHVPDADRQVREIEAKIANIHRAIEDGLADAGWANERLGKLEAELSLLGAAQRASGSPPRIDTKTALRYRRDLPQVLAHGRPCEKKDFLRQVVEGIKLAPDDLEVEITLRHPEPVMNRLVAGVGFEPTTFGL